MYYLRSGVLQLRARKNENQLIVDIFELHILYKNGYQK